MFYLTVAHEDERTALLEYFKSKDIVAVFHYVPLHSAEAGARFAKFHGEDRFTTSESERLIRLPIWFGLPKESQTQVIAAIQEFYS